MYLSLYYIYILIVSLLSYSIPDIEIDQYIINVENYLSQHKILLYAGEYR